MSSFSKNHLLKHSECRLGVLINDIINKYRVFS
jgi:hypothetical protein